ncbi:MAG: DapH/DapD/GlmU-related protein [Planctomycetota bacterium]|nr:DapH/DapD/GlmU-related protein [Planctomycetota bacterium]MDA1105329.1 DapH/DapD/GlmU-related protein [Planctomycetota bacterium]
MSHAESSTDAQRGTSPYSTREKVGRVLWGVVQATLFRWTFHNWYGVRRGLLGLFGAQLHSTARVRASVRIECPWNLSIGADSAIGDRAIIYCLGPVTIGARVTISQHAHLCAGSHDYRSRLMPLLRPPIAIGDDAWIAADAFVGPSVTVGEGAILGARAVALKSVPPWSISLGNPAHVVKPRPRPV